jgi:hypothetical protein
VDDKPVVHRRHGAAALERVLDIAAVLGRAVSLAALLVLAGAAGSLADGVPVDGSDAVTVTFDGYGP